MKLTVLMDNNTLIDQYLIGEPAASYFIEYEDKKILFDTGYSDAFIWNARKLGISLSEIDCVVLSHGHSDHTGGLVPLVALLADDRLDSHSSSKPALVAHPLALSPKTFPGTEDFGSKLTADDLSEHFRLELKAEPVWITERLVFLGQIPRVNDFEGQHPMAKLIRDGVEQDDFVMEDSALVHKSDHGLVVVTGCSHSGICNIIEYAKSVCADDRVRDVIGGFHLLDPAPAQLQGTIDYLKILNPTAVHACHCTDLSSRIAISKVVNLGEVGVGLTLEY